MKTLASFIKKAFPVPRLLVLSDVAIDFFDGRLSFFEFARRHGSIRPKVCGTVPFPRLHRNMKEGESVFAEAGRALKSFSASKGYQLARVVVHEGDVYAFKMRVPTLNPDEIRPAIESALEENVPIPPAEALFEYEVVEVDTVRSETSVAVSAISEKVIASYVNLLKLGGMAPVLFETEARSIARALIAEGDMGVHAVMAIREHHSVVFIVEKGKATFSAAVEVGSADLERAVSKTFDTSMDAARALMLGKIKKDGATEATLFDSMIPVFSTLRDELDKVLQYYKSESQKIDGDAESKIDDIILAGGDARTPGLVQYMNAASRIPCRVGSVWTNVLSPEDAIPELDERLSLGYGSLIGAHFS